MARYIDTLAVKRSSTPSLDGCNLRTAHYRGLKQADLGSDSDPKTRHHFAALTLPLCIMSPCIPPRGGQGSSS